MRPLVNHGREVLERGMATPGIVPAFDEVEGGEARVGLGAEAFASEQLTLERREEALTHGVVVGVTLTAHRWADTGLATAPAEGERRVLATFGQIPHIGQVHDLAGVLDRLDQCTGRRRIGVGGQAAWRVAGQADRRRGTSDEYGKMASPENLQSERDLNSSPTVHRAGSWQ